MDDIKSKIFDLINIQGQPKIPIVGSIEENSISEDVSNETTSAPATEPDRPSDQEILETIDSAFFNSDCTFDACRYELKKHENLIDVSKIQAELEQLKRQHLVVSNHVLQMILEKQSACQDEFNRIVEIQEQVRDLIRKIKEGRDDLGIATQHFTTASLGILANYRKRTIVQLLLRSLNSIRTLHKTESQMPKLLQTGDFPGAIALLLECLTVAGSYNHFTCIEGLRGKLQDTLEMTEEHLDVTLAKICYGFDETIYKKLQSAYYVLGKTQIAMDQLHMHFTSAVHSTASKVVESFISQKDSPTKVTVSQLNQGNSDDNYLSNFEFSALCKEVSEDNFIPCLLKLCKSLWCIILSYNHVVTWHQNNPINNGGTHFEVCFNEQTMKQKLNSGLNRLWHDIQSRVSSFVLAGNLANYKFDDFLQILAILHRLSQIGDELCGSESEEVASSIRTQSSNYFKQYHATKLDDLKVFLENEAWTVCPVISDFSVLHLQEFRGLRCSLEQCAGVDSSRHNLSVDSSSVDANFFIRYPDPSKATPFDISFQTDPDNEEILASIPDDLSGYYSEESEDETDLHSNSAGVNKGGRIKSANVKKDGPLLTNTTLTVLRLCGKYLQMSKYLKPIASQVVSALTQLFDFYLYTVYSFFTSDMPNTLSLNVSSLKLQAVLNRIRENLIMNFDDPEEQEQKVYEAQISPVVDLTSPNTLYGLFERVVGVESLLFLSKEFTFLKPYLEQLLQSQGSTLHNLQQFYSQTICVSFEVRKPVYACVSWRAVDEKYALSMMAKVDWEVKEVMSEHSKYVDYLINELQQFNKRLCSIKTNLAIPEEAYNTVWDNLIYLIANIFVEGFSYSKKCSHAGRALMQLDFTQLGSKVEKICSLRPLPHREFVENYIKAYYLVEDQLEAWIKEHREYTSKQLLSLVSCVCSNNKKSRQRLSALIEELERSGVR